MIVIFDTETTGLTPPRRVPLVYWPRVIEVACLVCDGPTIVKEWQTLVQPECPIPEKITKITGLTAADLEGQPTFREIWPDLAAPFHGCEMAIAHNFDFDWAMIDSEVRRINGSFPWPEKRVCTVQQYKHLYGRYMKQHELYEHFVKRPQAKAHRAMDDIKALHECLVAAKFFEEVARA